MAGYSGTPLAQKLGFKSGDRVYLDNSPKHFRSLLATLPAGVRFVTKPLAPLAMVHVFLTRAAELDLKLPNYRKLIAENGVIWVSWPKKAAKEATDVTEDVVRARALAAGLVDVKVCAVDDVWSGLKLVIRLKDRGMKS
ncbi:hypothetical protein AYO41_04570 [Verrucomicrobia bacterium SCGC AG-212-E04]|nr:hypothetical protein AYO41_04570 [Verrucomicrobia bacterium SCGC AG-212-E04]